MYLKQLRLSNTSDQKVQTAHLDTKYWPPDFLVLNALESSDVQVNLYIKFI